MGFLITITKVYTKEVETEDYTEAYKQAEAWDPSEDDLTEETLEVEQ